MAVLVAGTWLTYIGKSTEGLAAIIGAIATPAVVFITGRVFQFIERREKQG